MGAVLAQEPFLQTLQQSGSYTSQRPPAPWEGAPLLGSQSWTNKVKAAEAHPLNTSSSWRHFPVPQLWVLKGTIQKMMGNPNST